MTHVGWRFSDSLKCHFKPRALLGSRAQLFSLLGLQRCERLFNRIMIEHRYCRATMIAGRVVREINRCATAGTSNLFDADRQLFDFQRIQAADKIFLAQELRKAGRSTVSLIAAVVAETAVLLNVIR